MRQSQPISPLKVLVVSVFTALAMTACSTKSASMVAPAEQVVEVSKLIIHYGGYSPDKDKQRIVAAASLYGADVVHLLDSLRIVVVRVPTGQSVSETITRFEQTPGVLEVTRDKISHVQHPQ